MLTVSLTVKYPLFFTSRLREAVKNYLADWTLTSCPVDISMEMLVSLQRSNLCFFPFLLSFALMDLSDGTSELDVRRSNAD